MAGEPPIIDLADDLEDGEIDDDDDEEEVEKQQQQHQQPQQKQHQQQQHKLNTQSTGGSVDDIQFVGVERLSEKLPSKNDDDVVFLGLANNESSTITVSGSVTNSGGSSKSKKPRPLEGKYFITLCTFKILHRVHRNTTSSYD